MTNLSQVVNVQTMSSLEIAELTSKEHKNVLCDIRDMLDGLDGSDLRHEYFHELKDNRGYTILLNKELTLTLVSGYNVKMRHAIIKRWQELETKQEQPRQLEYTPEERANIAFKSLYEIAKIAEVPKSFALQECSKMASRASGCDITRLVTQGKYMDNVPDKDIMLEPTELGKHFDLSGKAMNEKLKELDLQYRHGENWLPTEKGKPICERHAWAVKNKSGYNLKWNWQAIDDLIHSTKK